ncbi:MAG TPA: signal peptidase I [Cytophagaceae bacterium]|jgi:signal peptidase I|nr:signal peptidase I [Cytophagaceae bacterium]
MNWKFWQKKKKEDAKPKSFLREWGDAILFAVIAATLIRWIFMEAFVIPTPSMENSLLMGDYLFVSKFHYGARTPKTPLQVPLTHRTIWLTEIPSYVEAIELPQFRLPGFSHVKNNDVVVFNWPADSEYPTDLKTNYIKRCQAISGDTLKIINKQVYINGQPAFNPPEMEFNYKVFTKEEFPRRIFRKYKIPNYSDNNGNFTKEFVMLDSNKTGYIIDLSKSKLEKMLADKVADSIVLMDFAKDAPDMQLFPYNRKSRDWNIDNYGPLWIPKEGATIKLDSNLVSTYETTIRDYEGWEKVEAKGDRLIIDGKEVTEYTFKQNYYFMMGDNRHNSSDSRFWGFVPADHIVGKGFMIWLSMDSEGGWSDKIRWNRLFNLIK